MSPVGSMKPSPEERLLALIRGKGKASAQASAQPAEAAGAVMAAAPSAKKSSQPLQWTHLVMAGLAVVLLGEGIFIVYQLVQPPPVVAVPVVPPSPKEVVAPPEPLHDVPSLAGSVTRPLFGAFTPAASPAGNDSAPQQHVGPSELAKQLVTRLTLTGIVAGESPQAVIEDNETKKTYFVTVGQVVAEGAVLEQVLDNRIILDLSGEKISLSL